MVTSILTVGGVTVPVNVDESAPQGNGTEQASSTGFRTETGKKRRASRAPLPLTELEQSLREDALQLEQDASATTARYVSHGERLTRYLADASDKTDRAARIDKMVAIAIDGGARTYSKVSITRSLNMFRLSSLVSLDGASLDTIQRSKLPTLLARDGTSGWKPSFRAETVATIIPMWERYLRGDKAISVKGIASRIKAIRDGQKSAAFTHPGYVHAESLDEYNKQEKEFKRLRRQVENMSDTQREFLRGLLSPVPTTTKKKRAKR